jgi:hypothetical protein
MEVIMANMQAIREKLDKEEKLGKFDRYAAAMKGYVKQTLLQLCEENEAFAAAVAAGDVFEDCMKAVAKGVGASISDLEVMRRAVKFYMKGADIRFQMVIVGAGAAETSGAGAAGAGGQGAARPAGRKAQEIIDITDFL